MKNMVFIGPRYYIGKRRVPKEVYDESIRLAKLKQKRRRC